MAPRNDPLQALKARSPQERWNSLKRNWNDVTALPRPTLISGAAQQPGHGTTRTTNSVSAENPFAPLAVAQLGDTPYSEPARDPAKLRRVTNILPYFDYEPDPKIASDDPCTNLCPRPDGLPCKPYPEEARIPQCPDEVQLGGGIYPGRAFGDSVFMWQASNQYHNPLYFEDPQLERYGHTHHALIQPFVSAARFSAQLLGMPYQMVIDPPDKQVYPLGWYRPGEPAPFLYYQVPWNTAAALTEAGVVTGLIFAIP